MANWSAFSDQKFLASSRRYYLRPSGRSGLGLEPKVAPILSLPRCRPRPHLLTCYLLRTTLKNTNTNFVRENKEDFWEVFEVKKVLTIGVSCLTKTPYPTPRSFIRYTFSSGSNCIWKWRPLCCSAVYSFLFGIVKSFTISFYKHSKNGLGVIKSINFWSVKKTYPKILIPAKMAKKGIKLQK